MLSTTEEKFLHTPFMDPDNIFHETHGGGAPPSNASVPANTASGTARTWVGHCMHALLLWA